MKKRMTKRNIATTWRVCRGGLCVAALVTLGVALFAVAPAQATVQFELAGGATKAKLKLRASSGKVSFAKSFALLTMRDPTCGTSSVLHISAQGQAAQTIELPCQNWRFTGRGYRYSDPGGSSGGVTSIVWKSRKLAIKLKGPAYSPLTTPAANVEVRLSVGDESYCGRFQIFTSNNPSKVVSQESSICAPQPEPTATATPTKTPTPLSFFTVPPIIFQGTPTPPPLVFIDSPVTGTFISPSLLEYVQIDGFVADAPAGSKVRVQGPLDIAPTTLIWEKGVSPGNTFSTVVILDPDNIFNPLLVELEDANGDLLARDRQVVVYNAGIASAQFSQQSLALRLNNSALHKLEDSIADQLLTDIPVLVLPGTSLGSLKGIEVVSAGLLLISDADVNVTAISPLIFEFGQNLVTDLVLHNFVLPLTLVDAVGSTDCSLNIYAGTVTIHTDFTLSPDAVDMSKVNVAQGYQTVEAWDVTYDLTFPCTINPPTNAEVREGFEQALEDFLGDVGTPAHPGPALAVNIEASLQNITPATNIGASLSLQLDAPMNAIAGDANGLTVNTDARMTVMNPPLGAPHFDRSVSLAEPFPTFGLLTPAPGPVPYDMAVAISTTAFNQLLKAQVEGGLLQETLEIVPADPTDMECGTAAQPITAGWLFCKTKVASFGAMSPTRRFKIVVAPNLAPIVDGQPGPSGELARLSLSQLELRLISCAAGAVPGLCDDGDIDVKLIAVADFVTGLDLSVDHATGSIAVSLATPAFADIDAVVVTNNLSGANVASEDPTLKFALITVIQQLVPSLSDAITAFSLPEFSGLQSCAVDVTRTGQFMSIYMNLVPILSTCP